MEAPRIRASRQDSEDLGDSAAGVERAAAIASSADASEEDGRCLATEGAAMRSAAAEVGSVDPLLQSGLQVQVPVLLAQMYCGVPSSRRCEASSPRTRPSLYT